MNKSGRLENAKHKYKNAVRTNVKDYLMITVISYDEDCKKTNGRIRYEV